MKLFVAILKHYYKTLWHKWFVFRAGLTTKANLWDLVIHDWTKFLPIEAKGYAMKFFMGIPESVEWQRAWYHHWSRNPHHWQFWALRYDSQIIQMPDRYIREMVADWMGASKAYDGAWPGVHWKWLDENYLKIKLHPVTRAKVTKLLLSLNYHVPVDKNDVETIRYIVTPRFGKF